MGPFEHATSSLLVGNLEFKRGQLGLKRFGAVISRRSCHPASS